MEALFGQTARLTSCRSPVDDGDGKRSLHRERSQLTASRSSVNASVVSPRFAAIVTPILSGNISPGGAMNETLTLLPDLPPTPRRTRNGQPTKVAGTGNFGHVIHNHKAKPGRYQSDSHIRNGLAVFRQGSYVFTGPLSRILRPMALYTSRNPHRSAGIGTIAPARKLIREACGDFIAFRR